MANSTVDGSVVVGVDMNISAAEKKLSKLTKDIEDTEREVEDLTKKQEAGKQKGILDAAEIEKERRKLQEMKDYLDEIKNKVKGKNISIETREAYKAQILNLKEEISEQKKRVNMLQHDWNKLEDSVDQYGKKIEEANERLSQQKTAAGILESEIDTAKLDRFLGAAEQKISSLSSRIASAFSFTVSKSFDLAKSFSKNVISSAKSLNVFSKLTETLSKKLHYLSRIIKRAFVFTLIYKGLSEVRRQMGAYLTVNAQFSSALGSLKGVLLTAFQPIYDTVLPALTALMNILSRVIAAISQFTSVLFGTTAKQAQKNAKALYNQANALKATGSAAEEAAGSLAGFDEINTIQTEKSGGGGGGANAGALFDWEYEDTPFPDWGEAFSSFLDKMLGNIPKLENAFGKFADWLNGLTKKLYDMFTFPGVLEKVEQLGRDLANAFNHLVDLINWYQLGQALGAGLNLALQFLTEFIYTFDWINLGNSLAMLVNGLVSEVDWYDFGRLLWAGFKIGIETLAGFLLGLDMVQLAKAASNIAIGFFDSITETIQKIDWKQIGVQIATFLANIEWAAVAESCFTAIGSAFGAATAFLWGLIKDAWSQLVDWWRETAFEDGKFTFTGLLEGILSVVKNIGVWIKEHIFDPFVNGFKSAFGIHSPSTVMADLGVYLMQGLLEGIKSKFAEIKNSLSGLWGQVKSWWKSNASQYFSISYWKNLGTNMIKGLLDGLSGIFSGLKNWASNVWSSITGAFSTQKAKSSISNSVTSNAGSRIAIQSLPSISPANIPALAKGAVIPPNREFMAVLGDQRNGTNLEAPEDLIRQIVREESGAGSEAVVALLQSLLEAVKAGQVIMVDKAVLGRTARDGINDITTKTGKFALLF